MKLIGSFFLILTCIAFSAGATEIRYTQGLTTTTLTDSLGLRYG